MNLILFSTLPNILLLTGDQISLSSNASSIMHNAPREAAVSCRTGRILAVVTPHLRRSTVRILLDPVRITTGVANFYRVSTDVIHSTIALGIGMYAGRKRMAVWADIRHMFASCGYE